MPQNSLKDKLYEYRPLRYGVQSVKLRNTPDCVFIWIPKTAGTSLFHWLRCNIGMHKMNIPRDYLAFPGYGAATFGHVHYLSLVFQGTVPASYHERAYKFAMVRNPYDRAISLYNYLTVDQGYDRPFEAFLDDVSLCRPPVGSYNHRGLSQTNPQVDWLMHWDGNFVTDEIFRVEEMEAALHSISKKFSVEAPPPLEARNVSKRTILLEELDKGSIAQIEDIYKRDFDVLGYKRKSQR